MAITFTGHKLHYIVDTYTDVLLSWADFSTAWVVDELLMYVVIGGSTYVIGSGNTVIDYTNKAFDTAYQPSIKLVTEVVVNIKISSSLSLSGGQSGSIFLETSSDNSNWTTKREFTNNNTGALTIGLNTLQTIAMQMSCYVPKNYYYRVRKSGTSTFTLINITEKK